MYVFNCDTFRIQDQLAKLRRNQERRQQRKAAREAAKAAIPRSISLASRKLTGVISIPNDGAVDWMAPNWPIP